MSVINCLPRNDAAISRDHTQGPSYFSSRSFLILFLLPYSFFFFLSFTLSSSSFATQSPSCNKLTRNYFQIFFHKYWIFIVTKNFNFCSAAQHVVNIFKVKYICKIKSSVKKNVKNMHFTLVIIKYINRRRNETFF